MRTPGLAAITMAFAIAACSDVAAPTAMGPDASSLGAVGHRSAWDAPRNGGHKLGDNKQDCDDHDRRWGKRSHHLRFRHWGWRHDRRHWSFRGHDDGEQDCGAAATGTISGSVANEMNPAAGYPVHLLKADGSAVVASATTDATGAYSFAAVAAGTYLVCEDDPFTEAHGLLGEARPQTGGTCPAGAYARIGFALTLAGGAALTGNDFSNMRLD